MASSVGPLFALYADMPFDWMRSAALDPNECVLRSAAHGQAWVATVVSKNLKAQLQGASAATWVYVAQILREDGEDLYAFASVAERALFLELKQIDSIGSKTAASAVAELGAAGLSLLLQSNSIPAMKVAGLGPKTLEKMRTGLKARAEKFARILKELSASRTGIAADAAVDSAGGKAGALAFEFVPQIPDVVLAALSQLGLKADEIVKLFEESKAQLHAECGQDLAKRPAGEQIKMLLALWGRYKKQTRESSV